MRPVSRSLVRWLSARADRYNEMRDVPIPPSAGVGQGVDGIQGFAQLLVGLDGAGFVVEVAAFERDRSQLDRAVTGAQIVADGLLQAGRVRIRCERAGFEQRSGRGAPRREHFDAKPLRELEAIHADV